MRSARVQLFTYAVIGIACAHAFRQDAAHTTLAENRWVSWIWFVEDRSWPYFPPCAFGLYLCILPKRRSGRGGLFTLGFAGRRRPVQSGVRVVAAYLEGGLRVVGDGCRVVGAYLHWDLRVVGDCCRVVASTVRVVAVAVTSRGTGCRCRGRGCRKVVIAAITRQEAVVEAC